MWKGIRGREMGEIRPNSFSSRIISQRISALHLSDHKDIVSPHRGSVNSLQVDLTEGRYLLSGASDASVAVVDVQRPTDYEASGLIAKHRSIFCVDKQHENGHKYAISSAIWYPIDTGLFITGSYDHYVKVWDTNTTQVVMNFKMPGKVYKAAMSPLTTSHTLIAAGSEDVQVRLCDVSSGAFSHTLSGHRDGVKSLQWSASSEWILMTGGCDGAIRFWDIRRAGCFLVLDQSLSQLGRRPPVRRQIMQGKVAALKSSGGAHYGKPKLLSSAKSSSSSRVPSKSSDRLRLHPGMLSTLNRATAHYGAVTGLEVTADGMYLLSAGSDSRIRLWDIESGRNTLVNFENTRLNSNKAIQLASTDDSALIFVPCLTTVKAFDIWSGQTLKTFRGHYESVNCCWFSTFDQELYTGGNDRQILVWASSNSIVDESISAGVVAADQDNWSD